MNEPNMFASPIGPLIARYLAVKRALGRRAVAMTYIFRYLDRFLASCGASDLTHEAFTAWGESMAALHPNTRRGRLRAVYHFCLYRQREHPQAFVPDPSQFPLRAPRPLPYIYSDADIISLLSATERLAPHKVSPLVGEVARVAIVILYTTGLRRGELVHLTLCDYDPTARVFHVRQTKFDKSRLVPLSVDGGMELDRYLMARRKVGAPRYADSPLLVHNHGGRFRGYTGEGIGGLLRGVIRTAGIRTPKGRAPRIHDLRFTFAVQALLRWYRAGVDVQARLPALATYLGHKSVVLPSITLPSWRRSPWPPANGSTTSQPRGFCRCEGGSSMTPSFPTQFATALRAFFAQHLPLTRGLSPRTVLSYRDTFVLLLRFLAKRHGCAVVDLELQHFRADDVLAFLEHLETERKNSVATRNARLAAVHSFARFLATRDPEQVAEAQRLLAVPIKRGPARAIDYLEGQEIGALMEAVVFHARDHLRDRALLLTLFNTGARVQEVLDIRTGDLQLERPTFVRLRGKGRKERLCPLWPETVTALQALLSATPGPNTVPIFRNNRGDPMTRFGVRYLLRCYAQQAQTAAPTLSAKRVHPHTCRHSAAVHLLRAGVDLVTISHWLGHASIETTNRYAAIDLETKRKALERAGPVVTTADCSITTWRTDASVLEWLEAL